MGFFSRFFERWENMELDREAEVREWIKREPEQVAKYVVKLEDNNVYQGLG